MGTENCLCEDYDFSDLTNCLPTISARIWGHLDMILGSNRTSQLQDRNVAWLMAKQGRGTTNWIKRNRVSLQVNV